MYEESGLTVELYNKEDKLNLGRVVHLKNPIHTLLENVGHEVENIDFIYYARAFTDEVSPNKGESKDIYWYTKDEIEKNNEIKPHVKVMALEALSVLDR